MKRSTGNTGTIISAGETQSASILNSKASNDRVGQIHKPTSMHTAVRFCRIAAVDDRSLRAIHRPNGNCQVVRANRRIRAVRHDNRHPGHRLVYCVLDRLERL